MRELFNDLGVELNIPPFLEGRQQLPTQEIESGQKIASLRIHVERAIGRMKLFKNTIPISLSHLTNQIILFPFLTNFQPVLIPLPEEPDIDVEALFDQLSDCSDTDSSDLDSVHD